MLGLKNKGGFTFSSAASTSRTAIVIPFSPAMSRESNETEEVEAAAAAAAAVAAAVAEEEEEEEEVWLGRGRAAGGAPGMSFRT
jgi:hypothetical protein